MPFPKVAVLGTFLLFLKACSAAPTDPVLDDDEIAQINKQKLGWTAGRNPFFEGMSRQGFYNLLGVKAGGPECPPPSNEPEPEDIPDSFDARTKWPDYVHPIRDQADCGSCWAFAASEVLSDRLAIRSEGKVNKVLSPQAFLTCDQKGSNHGCSGGWPNEAHDFLVHTGIPEDKCEPYLMESDYGTCPTRCIDGSFREVYKYQQWSYAIGESALKQALQTGPVAVTMGVKKAFPAYKSGVYVCPDEENFGLHAVKLVGYATTDATDDPPSTPYWIVANSWNKTWGENGYFRVIRKSGECGKGNPCDCGISLGAADGGCPITGVALVPKPSPPPAPAPASYHYGQPPCRKDEVNTMVRDGTVCATSCNADVDCPTDVPPGYTSKPACTTKYQIYSPILNKTKPFCVLLCDRNSPHSCPGGSTCAIINPLQGQLPGICTWVQQDIVAV